ESVMQLLDVFLVGKNVNQELGESTLLLQSIVDGMHNYTYIIDPVTHVIKYVNRNTQQGLPAAKPGRVCYEAFRNRTTPCEDCPIDRMIRENTVEDRCEMYLDSFQVWAKINASLITVNNGQQLGVFTGYDFSEHQHEVNYNDEDLNKFILDTSLYDALSLSTDDYIIICDMKTDYFYFPKKMVEEFELPKQVIKDAIPVWLERIHEDDKEDFMHDINSMMSGKSDTHNQEYRALNNQGTWVWLRARGHVERGEDGEPTTLVVVLTNLGKKTKVDHLTGLLDKYEFEVSTRAKLAQGLEKGVLLILGIDNFRYINSIYGWEFGDSVLKEASLRMISVLPEHIQLFRLDGDKFAAFFPDETVEQVNQYCQTLFSIFHQHRQFGEHRYYCTISGGCSWFNNENVAFGVMFKRATYALDCAKRDGKNRLTIYDKSTMSGSERLVQIMSALNESVEQGCKWFEVYYQPQIEPGTFRLKSAEALLRWKPPELGMISPAEFIPLLEQTGLIHKVGRWVLENAEKVCKNWRKYDKNFTISVNLSFAQLQDQSFLPYLEKQVRQGFLNPK
ncbi:MAG: EAL domain-containing protein, partial [Longicatena sp.]